MTGPAVRGAVLALLAAALFGLSTPLMQRAGIGLGPFTTAALLYLGAALVGLATRRRADREAALRRSDLPRLAAVAFFGACIGPVALAWGLQHTSGVGASLMLTLEALFTALLARALYGEAIDARVAAAMALLLAGGAALVVDGSGARGGVHGMLGLGAVMVATAAWGVDNALSRGLADRDPSQVVFGKAALGAAGTGVLAWIAREPLPSGAAAAALVVIGATGYGLSLRLYLLAQRGFGAARTGSVFAFAPFIGAAGAIVLGERAAGWGWVLAGALMMAGVVLHLAEAHDHEHAHEAMDHEHAHRHDDGHHHHVHDPMPTGAHSHPHHHEPMRHAHPHVPDLHHQHRHA